MNMGGSSAVMQRMRSSADSFLKLSKMVAEPILNLQSELLKADPRALRATSGSFNDSQPIANPKLVLVDWPLQAAMGRQKARGQQSQKKLDSLRESFVGQGPNQAATKPLFTALCRAQDCQPSFSDLRAVTVAAAKVRLLSRASQV